MRRRYPITGTVRDSPRVRRSVARAFTIIEVLFAMFLFVLMAAMVTVALTAATRTARSGNAYAQAMSIGQKKMDELQQAGFGAVEAGTTTFTSGVIDSATFTSHSFVTTGAGSGYEEAAFTTTDLLKEFFPSNVVGTIDVYPYGNGVSGGAAALTMFRVVITISWTETNGHPSSYSSSTILSSNVTTDF